MQTAPWALDGKTALITGITQGIGRVTAHALSRSRCRLLLVARDAQRGAAVVDEIKAQSGNSNVELLIADLSSQADIRKLAADVQGRTQRLDLLLNNAGAMFMSRQLTVDGLEMTFALNHLSYFLLTSLLLDLVKRTAQAHGAARIVLVASRAHKRFGQLRFDDPMSEHGYSGWPVYSRSKLANVLYTYELARRLEREGVHNVTVNCLHPGFIASGFGHNNSFVMQAAMKLAGLFALSPEEGAKTSIYLATSPDVSGVTGKYFDKCRPTQSSPESHDQQAATRLWELSEKLVQRG